MIINKCPECKGKDIRQRRMYVWAVVVVALATALFSWGIGLLILLAIIWLPKKYMCKKCKTKWK